MIPLTEKRRIADTPTATYTEKGMQLEEIDLGVYQLDGEYGGGPFVWVYPDMAPVSFAEDGTLTVYATNGTFVYRRVEEDATYWPVPRYLLEAVTG